MKSGTSSEVDCGGLNPLKISTADGLASKS
jgi:hypothetical protein